MMKHKMDSIVQTNKFRSKVQFINIQIILVYLNNLLIIAVLVSLNTI